MLSAGGGGGDGPASELLRVPLSALTPRWRGRDVAGAPPLRGDEVTALGIMIDKTGGQAGPFALEVVEWEVMR